MLWPLEWEESGRSLSVRKIKEWLSFSLFLYQPFVGLHFTVELVQLMDSQSGCVGEDG